MRLRLTRRNFLATCTTAAAGASLLTPGIGASRADASLPLGAPDDLIQLNSNENPYGLTPKAKEAMTQSAAIGSRYPDGQEDETRGAIARHHGVPTARLVLGCGSSDILRMADAAYLGGGKTVVAAEPTFEAVLLYAGVMQAAATKVPLTKDFRHDLPKMAEACNETTGLVYVCNPNNPTGTVVSREEMSRVPRAGAAEDDRARGRGVPPLRRGTGTTAARSSSWAAIPTSSWRAPSRRSTAWRACGSATPSLPRPTRRSSTARRAGTT